MILDGKEIALAIDEETKSSVSELTEKKGRAPRLALVCMGNGCANSRSLSRPLENHSAGDAEHYVKNIAKKCEEVGIEPHPCLFSASTKEKEILDYIKVLNADKGTDAIVVHRPLPIPDAKIIATIDPRKDAYGYFVLSRASVPNAVIAILERNGIQIGGKHAVIINRSKHLGIPLAQLLLKKDATVTVCHTKTFDLSWHTGQADIIITAAGRPGLVNEGMVKGGATVVDIGMTRLDGKWAGDVEFDTVKEKAGAITPVPGGVGPVALAMILKNVADIFGSNR